MFLKKKTFINLYRVAKFGYYITKLTPPQKKKKKKTLDTKNHGPNNNRPGADVLSAPV
jgi:hypothetical protein